MLPLKSLVLAVVLLTINFLLQSDAAPTRKLEKRLMLPLAPTASAINGVSIILENDVDSSKVKHSFLLLSQPRGYYDGMDSCLSLGDGNYIFVVVR
jgi:acetylcholinesterase